MAKLLIINESTYKEGVNAIGDIVNIFDDNHTFSETEHAIFDVAVIPNVTCGEFISALKQPEIQTIVDSSGVEYKMWRNSTEDKWRKLATEPKYLWTINEATEAQQALFLSEDVTKEEKLAVLAGFGNNISCQAENLTTDISIVITATPAE